MAAPGATKTVRFTQVVKRSGEPQVHTLWVAPDKDAKLQRAEKAHRVMTIHASERGGKAHVGAIGFDPKADYPGQFLIFPKSLKPFAGARVVGIKFDLVEQPKLSPAKVERSFVSPASVASSRGTKTEAKRTERVDRKESSKDEGKHAAIVAFTPPAEERKPNVAQPPPPPKRTAHPPAAPHLAEISADVLIREIRSALRELKAGKAVAAYQRLERAIEK